MNDREDKSRDEEIADYLFGEGDANARAGFEQRMSADPALRAEVEQLRALMADLDELPGEAWESVEGGAVAPPPLRLAESIAAERAGLADADATGAEPAAVSTAGATEGGPARPARERAPRRRDGDGFFARFFGGSMALRPAVGFAALALVFVGGLGAGVIVAGDSGDGGSTPTIAATQQATLAPVGDLDPAAEGVADFDEDGERIRLRFSGLAPSTDDDFYEAWMMDPEKGLISIGTFRVGSDGTGEFDLPAPVPGEEYPVIDISIEPLDGKPEHSQKSVLRGTLQ